MHGRLLGARRDLNSPGRAVTEVLIEQLLHNEKKLIRIVNRHTDISIYTYIFQVHMQSD